MKIGILTYHCVPNFGAQLQATSTVGYLKRMSHEPIVLNWYPKDLEDMYANRIPQEQIEAHNAYTNKYLPITSLCRTEVELQKVIEQNNLDAIIVGSDALFKYVPVKNRRGFSKRRLRFVKKKVLSCENLKGNPFFGDFITKLNQKIPTVAFSVSSQNCDYQSMTAQEITLMKSAMNNFKYISVRDEWTKKMVETITNKQDIEVTPDPVFSFNQNCYVQLLSKEEILKKYHLKEKYILISFSTWYTKESYIQQIADEVAKRGYQPVAFPMPEKLFTAGLASSIQLPLSPIDWYALIVYSAGYIGERMHPIVVCLHNTIPFFCFDEYGTYQKFFGGLIKKNIINSSKTYHILKEAGLENWMYSYKGNDKMLSSKYVVDRIEQFDKEKCSNFSIRQQNRYEQAIEKVLEILQKN